MRARPVLLTLLLVALAAPALGSSGETAERHRGILAVGIDPEAFTDPGPDTRTPLTACELPALEGLTSTCIVLKPGVGNAFVFDAAPLVYTPATGGVRADACFHGLYNARIWCVGPAGYRPGPLWGGIPEGAVRVGIVATYGEGIAWRFDLVDL